MVFEAIPKDESEMARRFRGYVAVDRLKFGEGGECVGHCNFDAGLCDGFANEQGNDDDFDWKLVSRQLTTYYILTDNRFCTTIHSS